MAELRHGPRRDRPHRNLIDACRHPGRNRGRNSIRHPDARSDRLVSQGIAVSNRVRGLVASMTLDEKVAQLTCVARTSEAPRLWGDDGEPSVEAIIRHHPHGVGQLGRPSQALSPERAAAMTVQLQRALARRSPGVGALFNEEGVHGHMAIGGTHFPSALGLAASWDPDLVERVYTAVAREVRARGSNYVYAPVLDLARDPRWGRVEETFGEDPFLVSALGVAAIRGLQGDSWKIPPDRVLACAKHVVAHGVPEGGRNAAPVHIGERDLRSTHLVPFRAAAEAGVGAMMAAYHALDGVPCHVNRWLLQGVLRDEWDWGGMVTSDGYAVPQLVTVHGVAANEADAAGQVLEAGVDAEVPEGVCFVHLPDLVRSGRLDEDLIDRAVGRVLTAKDRLGLLDEPDDRKKVPLSAVHAPAHVELALSAAHRSAVLLVNNPVGGRPLLPLDSRRGAIAVVGPNAAEVHLGGYSADPGSGSSVLDGMRSRFGDARIRYAIGCHITERTGPSAWWADDSVLADFDDQDATIAEAAAVVADCDVAEVIVGGDESTAREAWSDEHRGDRDSLSLPGRQEDLLRAIAATGTPLVAVVMGGRPLDLAVVLEVCDSVLQVWYAGEEGGAAIADLLAGDVAPSGHLPITMPATVGQLPMHSGLAASSDRRYLFTQTGPCFPFGYGLTYTTFSVTEPEIVPRRIPLDGTAVASATVTNTGTRSGGCVVQCYVGDRIASVARPERRLSGFQRLTLDPGEQRELRFDLGSEHLVLLDRTMLERVEAGEFDVWIGLHSATGNGAVLVVGEE